MSKKHKHKKQPLTVCLISYVPLLYGEAAQHIPPKKLEPLLKTVNGRGHTQACLWLIDDDGKPIPALAIEQAEKIADHLKGWTEGDNSWFTYHIAEFDNGYGMTLMPDITRSINRYKTARFLIQEQITPDSTIFNVIYAPIAFASDQLNNFTNIKPMLETAETIKVSLIDPKNIDRNNPQNTDLDKVHKLGEFTLKWGDVGTYLKTYLKDMQPPE